MFWGNVEGVSFLFQVHLGNMKYVLDEPASEKMVTREFLIYNLLVRIHFIVEMIWWTGLAPWALEFSLK